MQKSDRSAEKKARDLRKNFRRLVEVGVVGNRLMCDDLKLLVDIKGAVAGVEFHLDAGIGRFERQFLFDRHDTFNGIVRVNLLSGNKTVDARALGDDTDICRENNM